MKLIKIYNTRKKGELRVKLECPNGELKILKFNEDLVISEFQKWTQYSFTRIDKDKNEVTFEVYDSTTFSHTILTLKGE